MPCQSSRIFQQVGLGKYFDIMNTLSQPGGKLKATENLHKDLITATKKYIWK